MGLPSKAASLLAGAHKIQGSTTQAALTVGTESRAMKADSADVIVPVLNEADGLPRFYERVRRVSGDLNLVFIDNASHDNSVEIIKSFPNVHLIEHQQNEGYGGSIIDGIKQTTGSRIVIIDADCEYPPECVPDLLASLERNTVTYASRFLGKTTASQANMPCLKMFGNKLISSLFNMLFRQRTTDLYTGCKAFRRDCLDGIDLRRTGFEHVLELAAKLAHRGYDIAEIPVLFEPRVAGTAKMRHVSETAKFIWLLFAFFAQSKTNRL